jgi:outer membrane protein assembly factor BamA
MRRLCLILLAAALHLCPMPAGAINLAIEGNEHLSRGIILEAASGADCPSHDSLCVKDVCAAIAGRYWDAGYLDAVVECERLHPGSDTIRVAVTEGPLSSLKRVEVVGAVAFDETRLTRMFERDIGSPFSSVRLEDGIHKLLEFYDEQGYPAASLTPEMVWAGEGWVEVTLRVDEGNRATVGNVIFSGLTKTRRGIVLAESGVSVGGVYDGERIDGVPARLMALGVFEDVSGPVLSFGPGDSVVTVAYEVVEARANRAEGLIAYAPAKENGKVIGSLDLELGNIGGTLRRLRVFYDRPGPDRLRWSIGYREPRLAGTPVALDAGVLSDVLEASYARRKMSLGIRFRREARLEVGLGGSVGVTKDRTRVATDGDFSERGLAFDLRYEGRDRPANPRSGGLLSWAQEISSLHFEGAGSGDRTLSGLDLGGELAVEATRDNVLVVGSRFTGVFSSKGPVPSSHKIRLGGFGSLRGYAEEWFTVEEALVLTFEARRVLSGDSRFYAFVDGATIKNENREFGDLTQLPFGYGFGFVGGTRDGLFRLEIALGRGDTLSEAKLHLGLVRRF